jgi:uncharacterized protein
VIWFDFDNAPHVLFWREIISYLKNNKQGIFISARDFSYTKKMLDEFGFEYYLCKKQPGNAKTFYKYLYVLERSWELYKTTAGLPINLSLGHGSRSQILTSFIKRTNYLSATDYEHADMKHVALTTYTCVPEVIPKSCFGHWAKKIVHYPGFKEDMYLFNYYPKVIPEDELSLQKEKVVILFRPGDYYSHYQTGLYGQIEHELLNFFDKQKKQLQLILMPRHKEQQQKLEEFFKENNIFYVIPQKSYFGPDLIWQSDMVIGGGGTMLREACALNIPTYSFFSGKIGHVDQYYADHGQMVFIRGREDVSRIRIEKCDARMVRRNPTVFNFFRNFIGSYL